MLPKSVKQIRHVVARDARAGVRYPELHLSSRGAREDADRSSARGELDGVREQMAEHLDDPIPIGVYAKVGSDDLGPEIDPLLRGQGREAGGRLLEQVR